MDLGTVPLGTGLPDPKAAEAMATRAEDLARTVATLVTNLESTVAQARERIRAERRDVVPKGATTGVIASVTRAVDDAVASKTAEFRRTLAASSERDRYDQIRQAKETADRLAALVEVYPSPTAYLSGSTVGDARRTQYSAALATAGPAELQTYARRALADNDRALAAAVVGRLDLLPRDSRPFSAADFAAKFVGDEHRGLTAAAKRASAALQSALNANRAFERGTANPLATIAQGLRSRATAAHKE